MYFILTFMLLMSIFTRNGRIEFISGDNTAYADISQEKNVIMETSEKAYKAEGNGDIIEVEVST